MDRTQQRIDAISLRAIASVTKKLSQWAGTNARLHDMEARILTYDQAKAMTTLGEDELAVDIHIHSQASPGMSRILMSAEDAMVLVDILNKRPLGTTKKLGEAGLSALRETANIVTGVFLNEFVKSLDVDLQSSVPTCPKGTCRHPQNHPMHRMIPQSTRVFGLEAAWKIQTYKIKVNLFLSFGKKILSRLGKPEVP